MVNSRNKGNSFERYIARHIKHLFPKVATSRLMSKDADDRGMDLINTGEFAIQCKRYKLKYPNIEKALDIDTDLPYKIVIHKRNRQDVLVSMKFNDFLKLISEKSKTDS